MCAYMYVCVYVDGPFPWVLLQSVTIYVLIDTVLSHLCGWIHESVCVCVCECVYSVRVFIFIFIPTYTYLCISKCEGAYVSYLISYILFIIYYFGE